jgi:RNA polymerase sigma-70 factor (ECF subfamily)
VSDGAAAREVGPDAPDERPTITPDALVQAIPGLWRFARSMLRSDGDADDLVQETLVRALERSDSFRGESSVATWLHRIAHHLAVDRARRRSREVDVDDVEQRWADDRYTLDDAAFAQQSLERVDLEDALVHLPFVYRSVLLLHDVEGWTCREIAEATDAGLPATKQRLRRARMAMVSELARGAERRAAFDGVPLRCWDARRLVSDYLDGELDATAAAGVEAHLAGCPTCPPLYSGLVRTRSAMDGLRDADSVIDPATRERLVALCRGGAVDGHTEG